MVKRWKQEITLAVTILLCATGGGYFGGKMAQYSGTKAVTTPQTYDRTDTFGVLPQPEVKRQSFANPCVIVILVDDQRPTSPAQPAVYTFGKPLNPLQRPVNFI